jgi:hypothetical protein
MCGEWRDRGTVLMLAALLCTSSAFAQTEQLEGRFYAGKDSYMVGEPVLFNVEIKNTGTQVVHVHAKNPGGCLDTYEFSVSGPAAPTCGAKWNSECSSELASLAPGESEKGQWPLNYWYQFEREGKYEVKATRHVPVMSNGGDYRDFTFSSTFEVRLSPLDPSRVQSILEEFEKKLQSSDPEVRHAALDVLATTAPDYFERIALTISRSKDAFAVLHAVGALERINTAESRAALADLLTNEEPATENEILVRIHAIEALGHNGDASYQTTIARFLDDKNEHIQLNAMVAIAQLGKAEAVSQLQRSFFSPNPVTRRNVAKALRFSTTPESVEALINSLTDKDAEVRERILSSLTGLTGHSVAEVKTGPMTPEQMQSAWRAWWQENKGKLRFPDHLEFLCHMK